MKLKNTYFLLRHGEAKSNKERFVSCWPEKPYNPLTSRGREQIEKLIPGLKKKKIDLIFSSDLLRTKQTAQIIAQKLKLRIIFDKNLREIQLGNFNGESEDQLNKFYKTRKQRFTKKMPGGETYRDVRKRSENFLKTIEKKYKDKKILIVSHGAFLFTLQAIVKSLTEKQEIIHRKKLKLKTGELRKVC